MRRTRHHLLCVNFPAEVAGVIYQDVHVKAQALKPPADPRVCMLHNRQSDNLPVIKVIYLVLEVEYLTFCEVII